MKRLKVLSGYHRLNFYAIECNNAIIIHDDGIPNPRKYFCNRIYNTYLKTH